MRSFFSYPCVVILCLYTTAFAVTPPAKYTDKQSLQSDMEQLVREFDQFIRDQGAALPYVPGVGIKSTSSLIFWDAPNKQVALPWWPELSPEQQALFASWLGDDAEPFFTTMFNWFFVPHELGHFIQFANPDYNMTPYASERNANEIAVAFFMSKPDYRAQLDRVEILLQHVLDVLPKLDLEGMTPEIYFNTYYGSKLGQDPNKYAWFQFRFILDCLQNREQIDIRDDLKHLE